MPKISTSQPSYPKLFTKPVATVCMSMYWERVNKLADEGSRPALEGVEGFRYVT